MHLHKASLQQLHTFSLPVFAKGVIYAETVDQIVAAWAKANQADLPFLLLGEGSNVLFLEDFDGVIVLNRLKGIAIEETPSEWLLHVGAGENWHNLVERMLTRGVYGLENLALIPGCVGSAPIQNIGAYGVELDSLCRYVDLLDLTTHKMQRISALECQFGYRDSIFKHIYRDGYAIIAVGFKLTKCWRPTLDYGELTKLNPQTVSPKEIFDSVCAMRRAKLPDPAITGNAGSFFKNPVIPQHAADKILSRYPDMPLYPQRDGMVKLAAGWLIDRCNLKGFQIGGAAVHQNQALVIINKSHATGQDVADLAYYIRNAVLDNFDVGLEPEVRFVDAYGEIDAVEYLS